MLIKTYVSNPNQINKTGYHRANLLQNQADNVAFGERVTVVPSKGSLTENQISELKDLISTTAVEISKSLGLKHAPQIKFLKQSDIIDRLLASLKADAGYLFRDNIINFYLDEKMCNLYKISLNENGVKKVLINENTIYPVFGGIDVLSELVNKTESDQKFIIEPVTFEEYKKVFTSLIAHELRHAKQYDVMRRTKGMGLQKILEAERMSSKLVRILDFFSNNTKNYAYWINLKNEENQIELDSEDGKLAQKCLESTKNRDLINMKYSKEAYFKDFLEQDAYEYAATHVLDKFGNSPWGNYQVANIMR